MAAALASLVFSVDLILLTCSSARTQPLYPETLSSNPVGLKTAKPESLQFSFAFGSLSRVLYLLPRTDVTRARSDKATATGPHHKSLS